jgi:hypothetical protein
LQRVGAAVGDGRVRHLALDGDFHLQAAVVRGDHLVAKTCGDHQIGLGQAFGQQPAGAYFAAKLFVVSEVQFHAALQWGFEGFEGAGGKGEGGEVALAHSGGAAVDGAIVDFAAVGWMRPAFARRHHIAVRVQGNGFAFAIFAAHDQVGDRFEAVGFDFSGGHGVLFGHKAHGCQQLGGALGRGARCCRVGCRWAPAPALA